MGRGRITARSLRLQSQIRQDQPESAKQPHRSTQCVTAVLCMSWCPSQPLDAFMEDELFAELAAEGRAWPAVMS